jgi:ABC-type bacteriocin/lantibiotic exporter with double-glycine peptidase domain
MTRRLVVPGLVAAALLGGCFSNARPFAPTTFAREAGWVSVSSVPVVQQEGGKNCGAAVAAMLLRYWGMPALQEDVRAASGVPADRGLRAEFLRRYLRDRGLQAFLFEGSFGDFERELARGRPILVGVVKVVSTDTYAHYQLVVGVNRAREEIVVIDPQDGWSVYSFEGFMREWTPTHFLTMAVFPTPVAPVIHTEM